MSKPDLSAVMDSAESAELGGFASGQAHGFQINKSDNRYLRNPREGLALVADLISSGSGQNSFQELLRAIEQGIEQDFLALSSESESPKGAEIYAGLQQAYADLEDMVHFPEFENRAIVAVGGKFSAGKSTFLNSLLGDDHLLPIDTTPTTSIPTYILHGTQDAIFTLNHFQNKVAVNPEALHAISHEFKNYFNISFSHILKLITIERTQFPYANLMLLDTPGYNKADSLRSKHDNTDENIAREHLRNADFLIWLVDIQNGTIPQTDIEFIHSLHKSQPVLVVFNRADKRPESDVLKVIETARKDLKKNEVQTWDVIGYSSHSHQEFSPSKDVLKSFISQIDAGKPGTRIVRKFEDCFEKYESYHRSEKEFLRSGREVLGQVLFQADITEEQRQRLTSLSHRHKKQIDQLLNSEKRLKQLAETMCQQVREVCEGLHIKIHPGADIQLTTKAQNAQKRTLRLDGMIDLRNKTQLDRLGNFHNIPGKIKKVTSLGLFIDIGIQTDILISRQELQKEAGDDCDELFEPGDAVVVQFVGNKKIIVEMEI
ncbi:MAG: dynamin family protein [SAR324 cluster bacterium]|nr:dynamin family protein [SAR324 cluster bacterium]